VDSPLQEIKMSVIELEEVTMVDVSDDVLEQSRAALVGNCYTGPPYPAPYPRGC